MVIVVTILTAGFEDRRFCDGHTNGFVAAEMLVATTRFWRRQPLGGHETLGQLLTADTVMKL